eukprot:1493995-Pleurochrysis_carterae.AAC.1
MKVRYVATFFTASIVTIAILMIYAVTNGSMRRIVAAVVVLLSILVAVVAGIYASSKMRFSRQRITTAEAEQLRADMGFLSRLNVRSRRNDL